MLNWQFYLTCEAARFLKFGEVTVRHWIALANSGPSMSAGEWCSASYDLEDLIERRASRPTARLGATEPKDAVTSERTADG